MMEDNDPMIPVRLAERSLRGFTMGLLSLIPLFGLPLAALSIWIGMKLRQESRTHWNPGKRYAFAGLVLGTLSVTLQFGFVLTLGLQQTYFEWVFTR